MTSTESTSGGQLAPDVVRDVHFTHGTMLHPGYTEAEVDGFVSAVTGEVTRLTSENAQLREQVRSLQAELTAVPPRTSPSDQAVSILATAQLTADEYVAEAEEFSRQMTSEARAQFEEQLATARERAGAIIQAAQEAGAAVAARMRAAGEVPADQADLTEQVAYLRAFGQAVRTQLRSYLEALLDDVENEWGHAHPEGLPPAPPRARPRGAEPTPSPDAAGAGTTAHRAGSPVATVQGAVPAATHGAPS